MNAKAEWQIIAIIGRNWPKEFESKNINRQKWNSKRKYLKREMK